MKGRAILVVLAAMVLVAGCATTEPIWFIATPGYVETQIADSENAMRLEYQSRLAEKDRELQSLRDEIDEQRLVSRELASLSDIILEVEASNRELQDLAAQVEVRLYELPQETIQIIVEALSEYLQSPPGER